MSTNERLRALYRRFCEDQDFYGRCYARSLAETAAYHMRKRKLSDADNSEASADEARSKPPANEGE